MRILLIEDEEALRMSVQGHDLVVQRQTMADQVAPVTVTSPSGKTRVVTLSQGEPGLWRAVTAADELGLWQATDGTLRALISVGPANPKEFSEVTSSTEPLRPLTQATGGDTVRIVNRSSVELPRVLPVREVEAVLKEMDQLFVLQLRRLGRRAAAYEGEATVLANMETLLAADVKAY